MSYDITLKYKPQFLREMTIDGLNKLLNQAEQRFYELRHQCSPHGRVKLVEKPHLWKKIKKDIARIKTILAEGF
jgi:ribosomal protein L29